LSFLNRLRHPTPDDGAARPGAPEPGDTTPDEASSAPTGAAAAPTGRTQSSGIDVLFAGVSVTEFDRALDWYTRLFGRPPDINVHDDEVMWRITEGAWLYVVVDRNRAGSAVVTFSVGDLDTTAARIAARGVRTDAFEKVGDAGRKATFRDPDGNVLSFAEVYQRER
jgi:predicted enzyme related to lactoylglutathione lyase